VEIVCRVTGLSTLSGYTPYLTVKDTYDGTQQFDITGSVDDLNVSFKVTPTNNDIPAGNYLYEITISDGTDNYTIVQGKYIILDSVKY